MITISKQYSFDSAHRLHNPVFDWAANAEMFGKCNSLHGHTYTLTVEIEGPVATSTGMILNYFVLDTIVKPYVDGILDHHDLNEIFVGELTTSENMVGFIAKYLRNIMIERKQDGLLSEDVNLYSVTLQETPKTTARWTP